MSETTERELLPGKISITQPHGDGCDYISIKITDKSSSVEFIEVQIKYAEFARALGARMCSCEFRTRGLDLIGMNREHKKELVLVPHHEYSERERVAWAAIEPFNVDGWKGRVKDALNHHCVVESQVNGAVYRVSFIRWIKR